MRSVIFELMFKTASSVNVDITTKGQKIQQNNNSTTFNIIDPNWQGEIEEFQKKLNEGNVR